MLRFLLTRLSVVFIFLFKTFTAAAQGVIVLNASDGGELKPDSVMVWSSMGTIVKTEIYRGKILTFGPSRRIFVSADGYLAIDTVLKAELKKNDTIILVLQSVAGPLDEVVIASNKNPVKIARSAVSVSVLKPYLIENKITPDISVVLEQMPGVNIADGQVNIRSGSGWSYGAGSRVMVTLDGLPMLSPDAGAVQFSFLPVENLQSVEVIKSAGSVLYGSGALNGVINLRSAEPTEKAQAMISVFTGFYDFPVRDSLNWSGKRRGLHGTNGFWSQRLGRNSLTVQWNGLYDQGYRMNEFNHRARLSLRWMHDLKKVPGLKFGLSAGLQEGKSGSFLLWENYGMGYTSADSGFSNNRGTRFHFDPVGEWKRKKSDHKLQARILAIENRITTDDADAPDQSNGSSMIYAEYRFRRQIFSNNFYLIAGTAGYTAETHSPLFGGKRYANNLAAFSELEWNLKRLLLTGGARYEYFSVNNFRSSRPVFRGGANYRLSRATYLRASLGQGFRFPSMAEMFTSTSTGNVTIYANPDLRPESGWNAELGVKQGFRISAFKGYVDASVFVLQLNNMMEFTFSQWSSNFLPPTYGFGFKSVNTGKGRISGFELESAAEGKLAGFVYRLLVGYTFTNPVVLAPGFVYAADSNNIPMSFLNTRSDSNEYLKYRNRHLFKFDFQLSKGIWEAGLSIRYNSGFSNMDAAFVNGLISALYPGVAMARKKSASATIFDIRLACQPDKKWRINLLVSNLFNTELMTRPFDLRPPRTFQIQVVRKL